MTNPTVELDLAVRPGAISAELRREIEEWLYYEAELLDEWRLEEWLALFAPSGRYIIPTSDLPGGDPRRDLLLVQDDHWLLEQRVASLNSRSAHAEYPHSRTRHNVHNVRVIELGDDRYHVSANYICYRMRAGNTDCYVGHYEHTLERINGELKFQERKVILDIEALRPHGKLSIIL